MKLSTFLSIVAVLALLFGIGLIAVPAETLAPYGIPVERYTAFMARFFGEELIAVGSILWLARKTTDPVARRALVVAGMISDLIAFVIALQAQLSGLVNTLGWSTVLLYALFTIVFACYLFAPDRSGRT
jgi:hypothetical protein